MSKSSSGSRNSTNNRPIGVFDSGLGGLTVVREIRRKLPSEDIIYFGDLARLPYGIKSKPQILKFSVQNSKLLCREKVKAIVVACNSSSSAAFNTLKKKFAFPFVDVIEPAIQSAIQTTQNGKVGIIATQATIESGVYQKGLKRRNKKFKIIAKACPLLVPVVEEGLTQDNITRSILNRYLEGFKKYHVDTLILGCTHYPLLRGLIQKIIGQRVKLIDSAKPTCQKLSSLLVNKGLSSSSRKAGRLKVLISDKPRNFKALGERFLGERIQSVKVVRT